MALSVLIVEHSEIIRRGLTDILQGSGLFHKIKDVACAANIIDLVNRYHPDIVFINPSMIDTRSGGQLRSSHEPRPKLAAIVYGFMMKN
jgi:DNA-binding NarL/FixJ family response regulator